MIPDERLSTELVYAPFRELVRSVDEFTVDYELGGVALSNPTQGFYGWQWYARVFENNQVQVRRDGQDWQTLFTRAGDVTEIALAFDTNMRPFITFIEDGEGWFWWFDPVPNQQVFVALPDNSRHPRACLDEKRDIFIGTADTILAYFRDDLLCFRALRDRFEIEYYLASGFDFDHILVDVNRNLFYRLQFITAMP